jgi:hypothetical protein
LEILDDDVGINGFCVRFGENTVAYVLKARIVELEKQPLLANGSETFVSRRLGKNVPAASDTHATIEVLLEVVFSTRAVQRGYKKTTRAIESVLYGSL